MPVATDQLAAAWESFFRTTRRLRARAGKQSIEGLSLPQYHLLEALRDDDALTVGVLAEAAGIAPPTATRMLDCLERDGYVARRHSDTDRRAVLVSLTPSGRVALQAAHQQVSAWRRGIFESFTPEEREEAAKVLNRLTEALEEQMP